MKCLQGGAAMSLNTIRELAEWVSLIMLVVGIVTAALNATFGGFTPIIWFLIALWFMLVVICTEITRIRESSEKSKQGQAIQS